MNKKHNLPSALEVGQSEYNRLYYANISSGVVRARRQQRFATRRNFINFLKKDRPCRDCGLVWPPYVMDFDHRQGVNKQFRISRWVTGTDDVDVLQKEIMKCDLVCSNCHRVRTQSRLGKEWL